MPPEEDDDDVADRDDMVLLCVKAAEGVVSFNELVATSGVLQQSSGHDRRR